MKKPEQAFDEPEEPSAPTEKPAKRRRKRPRFTFVSFYLDFVLKKI